MKYLHLFWNGFSHPLVLPSECVCCLCPVQLVCERFNAAHWHSFVAYFITGIGHVNLDLINTKPARRTDCLENITARCLSHFSRHIAVTSMWPHRSVTDFRREETEPCKTSSGSQLNTHISFFNTVFCLFVCLLCFLNNT